METLKDQKTSLETTTHQEALLSAAAENNNIEMAKFLMRQQSWERRYTSTSGAPPFLLAIQEGNIEIMKVLQKEEEDSIKQNDNDSKNVLHYAFASKKIEEVTNHLKSSMASPSQLQELLTSKDMGNNTPLHTLAEQNLEVAGFKRLFESLGIKISCMEQTNSSDENPLHVAASHDKRNFVEAVLSLGENDPKLEELLVAKNNDSNTPIHLTLNKKRTGCPPLLQFVKTTKDPVKYLALENALGDTPFSKAVSAGDRGTVDEMLKDISATEKQELMSHRDRSNASPLHIAAEKGYNDILNLLLRNGAEITQKGPNLKTALEIAIQNDQREVIQSIIKSPKWKKAFRTPCTSSDGELNTPLRMLIRQIPDLAEEFLDRCCEQETMTEKETIKGEDSNNCEVIKINFDFIEDTTTYKESRGPGKKYFLHRDDVPKGSEEIYQPHTVDIDNHPLIIMANEKKVDLLQHPVCSVITERKWRKFGFKSYIILIAVYMIFLAILNLFVLTSPSPVDSPENFKCTEFFSRKNTEYIKSTTTQTNEKNGTTGSLETRAERWQQLEKWNPTFRNVLLICNFARVVFFFVFGERNPIWRQTMKSLEAMKEFRRPKLPLVFLFDFLIYSLALFLALHSLVLDTSCFQWQVGAITITLAWINLLLQMRLLYGIGIYIIIFKDVILTFLKISIVFFILLVGFAFSFHLLLSHRQEFKFPYDSMLKTIIMMSGINNKKNSFSTNPFPGEIEYGDIFFKDRPPLGWGNKWDQDWEKVPFPVVTYTMFLAFVICVTFVAFNVLVGLTVDDIRKFLGNADLRKLSMRLEFIRQMEQVHKNPWISYWRNKKEGLDDTVTKETTFGAQIWKEIQKRQVENKKKGKMDKDISKMQKEIKKLKVMLVETNKLIKTSIKKTEHAKY